MSPRMKAACAEARSALAQVALAAVGHGELACSRPAISGSRAIAARSRSRSPRRRSSRCWSRPAPAPSMTWISVGLRRRAATAWRSGAIASAGLPAFEQRLALELVEIRVVGLRLDQPVDLGERLAQVAVAVGRDGARIARRQAGVARADSGARPCRAVPGSRRAWRASGRGAAAAPADPSCPNRGSPWRALRARRRARPASGATA